MNKSYKGKILISTPDLSGDIFSRSVVLLIEHNHDGAFGLILNKKDNHSSLNLKEILGYDIEVYNGGPVEPKRLFFMIKGPLITDLYLKIDQDFYLTEDIEAVIYSLAENKINHDDFKVFTGYSGWSAQQLEKEIEQKFWISSTFFPIDYTAPSNTNLWKSIMQNLGGEHLIWANSPVDIHLN